MSSQSININIGRAKSTNSSILYGTSAEANQCQTLEEEKNVFFLHCKAFKNQSKKIISIQDCPKRDLE